MNKNIYYYKFRVVFDEIEDFIRDIEIISNDTFESFHQILYASIGLEGNELASFFICDAKWNKQKEITLIDMEEDVTHETPVYDDEDNYSTKSSIPKFVMANALIKDFIYGPHQHIMYEYDFLNPKIFYIELLKTLPTDNTEGFPKCTYSEKLLPIKNVHTPLQHKEEQAIIDDANDLFDEFDDLYDDEDEDIIDLENFDDIRDFE